MGGEETPYEEGADGNGGLTDLGGVDGTEGEEVDQEKHDQDQERCCGYGYHRGFEEAHVGAFDGGLRRCCGYCFFWCFSWRSTPLCDGDGYPGDYQQEARGLAGGPEEGPEKGDAAPGVVGGQRGDGQHILPDCREYEEAEQRAGEAQGEGEGCVRVKRGGFEQQAGERAWRTAAPCEL